jgi:OmcA/MtrC family decaheme c-type cytochrome
VNPPGPSAYKQAEVLNASITSAALNEDNQVVIQFQLSDGKNIAILDLTTADVRFVLAKLEKSALGNLTGTWQSYINVIAQPAYGTGTVNRLQASYESDGEFTNNGNGTYTYRYATSLTDLPQDILDQAATEGLDLSFNPNLTHRVAMQFDNNDAGGWANPHYDWVPQTGATDGIFTMDIAATANCNRCHDPLAVHGSGRREVEYCVTCHNAGTVDPDSTNTVDMKVMIHKIHRGANLPSVQAGEPYVIYGYRGGIHDYSQVHFPQDIRNCVNCHAGSATGTGLAYPDGSEYGVTLTSQGDNWTEVATQAACGSCHDDVDFETHKGGQPDDANCAQCHAPDKKYGIQNSHRILTNEARQRFAAEILSVTNTMPGEFPQVQYKVFDPTNDNAPYDLTNDPVWASVANGASRLAIDLAWNTTDYTNSGNGQQAANVVSLDALADGTPVGDGSYTITSSIAIPNGTERPFVAATGSGMAGIEGHPAVNMGSDTEPDVQSVALTNANAFFSISEADGDAVPRRTSVVMSNCLACHQTLSLHGNNRTDDVQVCVACHNPRNTDRDVREIATMPPTDGKDEESLDFKTMVHGIHAAGMRVNPLQIVGFRGFSTYVYDEEAVQYPGNLGNCVACHTDNGYTLPLADGVLATTIDTGADHESPADDTVVTPVSAVCSSCHDSADSKSHMIAHGGNFSTTQAAIDSREVFEDCNSCHRSGSGVADVTKVHRIP